MDVFKPPRDSNTGMDPDKKGSQDCMFTLEVQDREIPLLISQIVQDGTVLDHPALKQHQPIPTIETCPDLKLLVQTRSETDPDEPLTSTHVLSPLAKKASDIENLMVVSI